MLLTVEAKKRSLVITFQNLVGTFQAMFFSLCYRQLNFKKMNIEKIEIRQSTRGYFADLNLTLVRNESAISVNEKVLNESTKRKHALKTFKYLPMLVLKISWVLFLYRFNWQ